MAKKKNKEIVHLAEVETPVVEPAVEETVDAPEESAEQIMHAGVVTGCALLNVRKMPAPKAAVIHIINKGAVVEIDKDGSMGDFYKVKTEDGIVGFCKKEFINIL